VLATDLVSPFSEKARERFERARELLGSDVRYEARDLFELEGAFDAVFAGYVLQMVRDPVGALEHLRGVCSGHLLLLETVSLPLTLLPSPLARLDARRDGRERFVFNPRGLRKAVELAGWTVDEQTRILFDQAGPLPEAQKASRSWKYRLRVRGCSCGLRATPTGSSTRLFGRAG
jgi:hypothetical protein